MFELFLSSLEDQLGLIVDPPLAPIARMGIISQEITRITERGLTPLAADVCPACRGDGLSLPVIGSVPCSYCNGTGKLR